MTLGQQGIGAFVVEQKDSMVTQMITEMYRQGEFKEYPSVFRLYKPMEIHNITSLKNAVAPQYGLLLNQKVRIDIYETCKVQVSKKCLIVYLINLILLK